MLTDIWVRTVRLTSSRKVVAHFVGVVDILQESPYPFRRTFRIDDGQFLAGRSFVRSHPLSRLILKGWLLGLVEWYGLFFLGAADEHFRKRKKKKIGANILVGHSSMGSSMSRWWEDSWMIYLFPEGKLICYGIGYKVHALLPIAMGGDHQRGIPNIRNDLLCMKKFIWAEFGDMTVWVSNEQVAISKCSQVIIRMKKQYLEYCTQLYERKQFLRQLYDEAMFGVIVWGGNVWGGCVKKHYVE